MVVAVRPRAMAMPESWMFGVGHTDGEVTGRLLRELRAEYERKAARKLSQAELAEVAGVTQTIYSRWERGWNPPNERSMRLLEEFFGLPMFAFNEAILEARREAQQINLPLDPLPSLGVAVPAREHVIRLVGPILHLEDDVLEAISDEDWQRFLENATRLGRSGRRMADATVEDLDVTDAKDKTG